MSVVMFTCYQKLVLIFLNQTICCGYLKEPSQRDSFEHPKHMLKLVGKKKKHNVMLKNGVKDLLALLQIQ